MAFLQTDIDDLKAAIATGAMRVRYADGREVQYRTLGDMRDTLRMMEAEVTPASTDGTNSSRAIRSCF